MLTDAGPRLVELNPRQGGGYIFDLVHLVTGTHPLRSSSTWRSAARPPSAPPPPRWTRRPCPAAAPRSSFVMSPRPGRVVGGRRARPPRRRPAASTGGRCRCRSTPPARSTTRRTSGTSWWPIRTAPAPGPTPSGSSSRCASGSPTVPTWHRWPCPSSGAGLSPTRRGAAGRSGRAGLPAGENGGRMSTPLDLRFLLSADDVDRLPDTPAEVASSVGRTWASRRCSTPWPTARSWRTRPRRPAAPSCSTASRSATPTARPPVPTVVDCPGYGYASVSKTMRASWQTMIEGYLARPRRPDDGHGARRRRDRPHQARRADARLAARQRTAAHGRRHQARQGALVAAREAQARPGRRAATSTAATSCGRARPRASASTDSATSCGSGSGWLSDGRRSPRQRNPTARSTVATMTPSGAPIPGTRNRSCWGGRREEAGPPPGSPRGGHLEWTLVPDGVNVSRASTPRSREPLLVERSRAPPPRLRRRDRIRSR